MQDEEFLADRFEEHRPRLRAVAYRMLGSHAEADDALQETWLRISRAHRREIDNIGGWLTTVVSRQCLNMLRARATRREDPLDVHVPDPVVQELDGRRPGRAGSARRHRRHRAAGRARRARPRGAACVRAARHVRAAVRRDRPAGGAHAGRGAPAGQPGAAARAGPVARRAARSRPAACRRRRVVRPRRARATSRACSRSCTRTRCCASTPVPDRRSRRSSGAPRRSPARRSRSGTPRRSRRGSRWSTALAGIVASVHGQAVSVLAFTVVDGLITEIDILSDRDRLVALGIS